MCVGVREGVCVCEGGYMCVREGEGVCMCVREGCGCV